MNFEDKSDLKGDEEKRRKWLDEQVFSTPRKEEIDLQTRKHVGPKKRFSDFMKFANLLDRN